jgi:hypothetical protein
MIDKHQLGRQKLLIPNPDRIPWLKLKIVRVINWYCKP